MGYPFGTANVKVSGADRRPLDYGFVVWPRAALNSSRVAPADSTRRSRGIPLESCEDDSAASLDDAPLDTLQV